MIGEFEMRVDKDGIHHDEAGGRGGRPRHYKGEVKKAAIAVRTAPSIRDRLRLEASANGRSVTQEVEIRLVRSFDEQDHAERFAEVMRELTAVRERLDG